MSIDLEDVRDWVKNGYSYREAVPENTRTYLALFKKLNIQATFFIVGRVARRYPELICEIAEQGHELACHGDMHVQLDKLTPESFRADLLKNIEALNKATSTTSEIHGFRAPTFSLTSQTAWAHEVLADLGFTYSSSVLPATNPLYGWPEFGKKARQMNKKIWELPITLHSLPGLRVPIAGGVYFRVLPFALTKWAVRKKIQQGEPVGSYLHPYDIDTQQERFMHPDLNEKQHLNMLMYLGRGKVLQRLTMLNRSCSFQPYGSYVSQLSPKPC
jgi:polysaccharide deacetylase family protein (PEP-CTERM system associated)